MRLTSSPAALAANPLRLVIAGEFAAGKSTAINALLRRRLIPSAFGGLKAPIIRLRHGAALRVSMATAEGTLHPAASVAAAIATGRAAEIRVEAPFPALRGVEIVRVPARPDNVFDEVARAEISAADMLIWCSISSQAWRLSEKAFVEDLPKGLRARSVLVLSRADKLRSNEDCDKIMRRLEREAATYFANVIFMGGAPDLIDASATDDQAWQDTGGQYILDLAQEIFDGRGDAPLPSFPDAVLEPLSPAPAPAAAPILAPQSLPDPALPDPAGETAGETAGEPADAGPAEAPEGPDLAHVVPFKPHRPADPAPAAEPHQDAGPPERAPVAPNRVEFVRGARAEPAPGRGGGADPAPLFGDLEGLRFAALVDTGNGRVRRALAGTADPALAATAALLATTQARAAQLSGADEPLEEMLVTFGGTALVLRPLDPDARAIALLALDREGANVSIARVMLREATLMLARSRG